MGCFWGPQSSLSKLDGVKSVVAGYTGGKNLKPSYKSVCGGDGHKEAVCITYDDTVLSYESLLQEYFSYWRSQKGIPPLDSQYAPSIWTASDSERDLAVSLMSPEEIKKGIHKIEPRADFFKAEEYHQNYETKQKPRFVLLGAGLLVDLLPNQDPWVYKLGAALTCTYIAITLGERLLFSKVEKVVA